MSYRHPSPEARARYIERSRELWSELKSIEDRLKQDGLDYAQVLDHQLYEEAFRAARTHDNTCSECGGTELRMENYSMMWHDGDLVCETCDTYVRMWDAG